jgi:nucleotide-binding universal stress UspA family protein
VTGEVAEESLRIIAGSGLTGALCGYAAMSGALPEIERDMYEQVRTAAQRSPPSCLGTVLVSVDAQHGDPAVVFVESTRTLDLPVLGSHGYGRLRHVPLGGVALCW